MIDTRDCSMPCGPACSASCRCGLISTAAAAQAARSRQRLLGNLVRRRAGTSVPHAATKGIRDQLHHWLGPGDAWLRACASTTCEPLSVPSAWHVPIRLGARELSGNRDGSTSPAYGALSPIWKPIGVDRRPSSGRRKGGARSCRPTTSCPWLQDFFCGVPIRPSK